MDFLDLDPDEPSPPQSCYGRRIERDQAWVADEMNRESSESESDNEHTNPQLVQTPISEEDSDEDREVPDRYKARIALPKPSKWKKSTVKNKTQSGQAYESRFTGKQVPARQVKEPCTCRAKCYQTLGEEVINDLKNNYYALANHDLQSAYIAKCVQNVSAQGIRVRVNDINRKRARRTTKLYTVHHQRVGTLRVCASAFWGIHGLGKNRVYGTTENLSTTGTAPKDSRGKNTTPRLSEQCRNLVREHIRSLTTITSHYSRTKNPYKRYLPATTTIKQLYTDYVSWMNDKHKDVNIVKLGYYRDTFNQEFNIDFEIPKSDTCNKCDSWRLQANGIKSKYSNDATKMKIIQEHAAVMFEETRKKHTNKKRNSKGQRVLDTQDSKVDEQKKQTLVENDKALAKDIEAVKTMAREFTLHRNMADSAQDMLHSYLPADPKKKRKEGENYRSDEAAIVFDLAQGLATPRIPSGLAFYKRKLWTYMFGIHDIKTGDATMHVWDESLAKRGSCEVASCLMHYIDNSISADTKSLIVFCDNCGGQNKNINMNLFFLRLIHMGRFTYIKQVFMISGHSFLPCDSDFGVIQSKMKGHKVFTRDHYVKFIESSRENPSPFQVVNMQQDMFCDVFVLQDFIVNRKLQYSKFSDGKMFEFSNEMLNGYVIRTAYSGPGYDVTIEKRTKSSPPLDLNIPLPPLYSGIIQIDKKKMKDVEALMTFVEHDHLKFFHDLISGQQDAVQVTTRTGKQKKSVVGEVDHEEYEEEPDMDGIDYDD